MVITLIGLFASKIPNLSKAITQEQVKLMAAIYSLVTFRAHRAFNSGHERVEGCGPHSILSLTSF